MKLKTILAAAALVAGTAVAASAGPLVPANSTADASTMLESVHYRPYPHRHDFGPRPGRCWVWRQECADRWGWGTWRFRRCLIRHGCF